MTYQEYRALMQRTRQNKSKYGAKRSGKYASRKEHQRALELKAAEQMGLISNLREQQRFQLIPSGIRADGTSEAACWYIADFVYTDAEGNTVVEDVKGYRTKEYIIKRKLMLHVHGITIKET